LAPEQRRRRPVALHRALHRPGPLGLFQLPEFVPEIALACAGAFAGRVNGKRLANLPMECF